MSACASSAIAAGCASDIQQMIQDSESRTAKNTGMNLTFAFDYGGQEEIAAAARELARAAARRPARSRNHHAGTVRRPPVHQRACRSPIW